MRVILQTTLSLAAFTLCLAPLCAQTKSSTSEEQSGNSSSTTSSSSSSMSMPKNANDSSSSTASPNNAGDSSFSGYRPMDTGAFTIPTEKTSITFVPKFKQRITDLGDQIRLVQGKGFITQDEASKLLDRQSKLFVQESEVSKRGFPKADLDVLEKAITLLNADLFKAMRKSNPVQAGPAEKEVNDPNLIPAYSDPELQPGSGHISEPKK